MVTGKTIFNQTKKTENLFLDRSYAFYEILCYFTRYCVM